MNGRVPSTVVPPPVVPVVPVVGPVVVPVVPVVVPVVPPPVVLPPPVVVPWLYRLPGRRRHEGRDH